MDTLKSGVTMGSQAGWYTRARTCKLLRLRDDAPAALSSKGLLATNGAGGNARLYAKEWVDELAILLARYPPMHTRDEALFELYVLYREYHSLPDATRGRRDRLHARVKLECERLHMAQKLWTHNELAAALGMSEKRMRVWALAGKLSALKFGTTWYLTTRYAKYVVEVYTRWKTAQELAAEWDVPYSTVVGLWIERGELPAVRFADGMYRIDPEVFRAFVAARAASQGVTMHEAVRRIGCSKTALRTQISRGSVASFGHRQTRRIPEQEVARWEKWFHNLNTEFAWLQPVIMRPDHAVQTLTAQQTQRALKVSAAQLTMWSQEGLLPYFPRSFLVAGPVVRAFVRRYIRGLVIYAGGGKVTRRHVVEYKELCKRKQNIV